MAGKTSRVDVVGPLGSYQVGFEAVLADAGYAPLSAANQVRLMRHLSMWLQARDLGVADLAPVVVREYLAWRRADGYTCWLSARGVRPLLTYLRGLGVVAQPVAPDLSPPLEALLERYRCYLVEERGLVPATVLRYLAVAREFLMVWVDECGSRLAELDAAGVSGFVVRRCARSSVGSAKTLVTVPRSLLRFLLVEGLVPVDLSGAVPVVAGWRGGHLPKGITPAEVQALLASCERPRGVLGRPRVGQGAAPRAGGGELRVAARRDRAILLLLVRLGLRAGEVTRIGLDDVDWRRGELVIRGKGRRDERLPLPTDVGQAIVDYLRHDRPSVAERALFINVRVPYSAMMTASVQGVVVTAARRAGLVGVSAHRLRHTAATQMLHAQAPLGEVGQVLRHRSAATTAIYAKVDRGRLRELALAWPQVSR